MKDREERRHATLILPRAWRGKAGKKDVCSNPDITEGIKGKDREERYHACHLGQVIVMTGQERHATLIRGIVVRGHEKRHATLTRAYW